MAAADRSNAYGRPARPSLALGRPLRPLGRFASTHATDRHIGGAWGWRRLPARAAGAPRKRPHGVEATTAVMPAVKAHAPLLCRGCSQRGMGGCADARVVRAVWTLGRKRAARPPTPSRAIPRHPCHRSPSPPPSHPRRRPLNCRCPRRRSLALAASSFTVYLFRSISPNRNGRFLELGLAQC